MTSLHYYFPWAMKSLLKWSAFCVVTDRARKTGRHRPVVRRGRQCRSIYDAKILAIRGSRTSISTRTAIWKVLRDSPACNIDEMVYDYIVSPEFRSMLTSTIQQTYPTHEWERFEGHFGGLLLTMWADDNAQLSPTATPDQSCKTGYQRVGESEAALYRPFRAPTHEACCRLSAGQGSRENLVYGRVPVLEAGREQALYKHHPLAGRDLAGELADHEPEAKPGAGMHLSGGARAGPTRRPLRVVRWFDADQVDRSGDLG